MPGVLSGAAGCAVAVGNSVAINSRRKTDVSLAKGHDE
jgi:hypothetical protein